MKKYIVTLTEDERKTLGDLKSKGTQKSQKILNALMLLLTKRLEVVSTIKRLMEISKLI